MAEEQDKRRTIARRDFERRVLDWFPEAHVERHPTGEMVIYTGWVEDRPEDSVLRWLDTP